MGRTVAATVLAIVVCACAPSQKRIIGDIVILRSEGGEYYLQRSDRDNPELGFGPLKQVGWMNGVVVAEAERWGWRVIDANTGDGWHSVLSVDEAEMRTKSDPRASGIWLMAAADAWRVLP